MGGDKPRNRIALACLLAALALAGCGSTKVVTTTAEPPGVSEYKPPPPPVAASYAVSLAGFKLGSHTGTALALVDINPTTNELCWRFTQLADVPHPTVARLFRIDGPNGFGTSPYGYALGNHFKPSGCIPIEHVILGLIESKPTQFFVNIHDAEHPLGAVRGPLG
jgi:hypothetical protein